MFRRILFQLLVPAYLEHAARAETKRIAGYLADARAEIVELRDERDALQAQMHSSPDFHVINFDADGWTLQHPLSCRPNLFSCEMNRAVQRACGEWDESPREHGCYRVDIADDGDICIWVEQYEEAAEGGAMDRLRAANPVPAGASLGADWDHVIALDPWHISISRHFGQWHIAARLTQGSESTRVSAPTIAEALRLLREEVDR